MVLPVVVASETEVRGGRNEGREVAGLRAEGLLQLSWLLLPRRSHFWVACLVGELSVVLGGDRRR